MERLTIPDVRVDEHTTRRTMIDGEAVREHAMDFYWRLKAYEDTGLTPEDCARAAEIDDILLDEYYPIGRMRNLIKADKEGRVIVLPAVRYCEQYGWQNITWDEKYGVCAGSWNTCEEAEKALEAMKK
jgi:hypothetical protein